MTKSVKIFMMLAVLALLTIPAAAESYQGSQHVSLAPGETITVPRGLIPGIQTISLELIPSGDFFAKFYDYRIIVKGACPRGFGSTRLLFTDKSGDQYKLVIISSSVKYHVLRYHSYSGKIKNISWYIR